MGQKISYFYKGAAGIFFFEKTSFWKSISVEALFSSKQLEKLENIIVYVASAIMKLDIHNHILPESWPDLKEVILFFYYFFLQDFILLLT